MYRYVFSRVPRARLRTSTDGSCCRASCRVDDRQREPTRCYGQIVHINQDRCFTCIALFWFGLIALAALVNNIVRFAHYNRLRGYAIIVHNFLHLQEVVAAAVKAVPSFFFFVAAHARKVWPRMVPVGLPYFAASDPTQEHALPFRLLPSPFSKNENPVTHGGKHRQNTHRL